MVEIVGSPSGTTTTIQEDDGKLNELVRIFLSGMHPFPLEYQVSATPSSKPLYIIHRVSPSYIIHTVVYSLSLNQSISLLHSDACPLLQVVRTSLSRREHSHSCQQTPNTSFPSLSLKMMLQRTMNSSHWL